MSVVFNLNSYPELEFVQKNLEKNFGAFYVFYFLEHSNSKNNFIISSIPSWSELYIKKLITNCPIKKNADQLGRSAKTNYILPWFLCHPSSSDEINITLLRKDFDIGLGLSICKRELYYSEFFALAPFKENSINFTNRILYNHEMYLDSAIISIRNLAREIILKDKDKFKIV